MEYHDYINGYWGKCFGHRIWIYKEGVKHHVFSTVVGCMVGMPELRKIVTLYPHWVKMIRKEIEYGKGI